MMEYDKEVEDDSSMSEIKESSGSSMSKNQIIRNIIIVCLNLLVTGIAMGTLMMLQSTLNKKEGIGLMSQAIMYGTSCVSSLILSKYLLRNFGSKKALVISYLSFFPYIAANYYPVWEFMIPASIILGIGSPLYWNSQGSYLTDISSMLAEVIDKNKETIQSNAKNTKNIQYGGSLINPSEENGFVKDVKDLTDSDLMDGLINKFENGNDCKKEICEQSHNILKPKEYSGEECAELLDNTNSIVIITKTEVESTVENMPKKKTFETVAARVFGIHGMAFTSATLWGTFIPFFIFQDRNAISVNATNTSCSCGSEFCSSESVCLSDYAREITNDERYILVSVYIAIVLVCTVSTVLLLDPLGTNSKKVFFSKKDLVDTMKFAKRVDALFLLPLTLYVGMIQGFFYGDFTKDFVDCALGLYHIPLIMACYSLFSTISSTASGWLVKSLGRKPVFSLVALLNAVAILILFFWVPNSTETDMYFIMAAMIGTCVGILWSQTRALYGIFFEADKDAAFSTLFLWYSLGFGSSFLYSNYICTLIKIYILLVISTIAFIGYLLAERNYSLKQI